MAAADLSRHAEAGTSNLTRPPEGHTWRGDVDVFGYIYQAEAYEQISPRGSKLVLKLYFLPPTRPPYAEPGA